MNRKAEDIMALLELTIDSCIDLCAKTMTPEEQHIIDKLKSWERKLNLEIQHQHLLEAPMDDYEFKDVVNQITKPIIDSVFEQARSDGVITPDEHLLLDNIVSKLHF